MAEKPLNIRVTGITGRMGQAIAKAALDDQRAELMGAFSRNAADYDDDALGKMLGLSKFTKAIESVEGAKGEDIDSLIDFTHPSSLPLHLDWCKATGTPLVLGTTGLSEDDERLINEHVKDIPILYSGNMSFGIAVMQSMVEKMAKVLGEDFDIEVIETHHRYKKDAPSGTAYMLANAAAKGRGLDLSDAAIFDRQGETGERDKGMIGMQSIRGGDVIGDHTVMFLGSGERLEITHKATDRSLFAKGAVHAAKWLHGQAPGLYTIRDVVRDQAL